MKTAISCFNKNAYCNLRSKHGRVVGSDHASAWNCHAGIHNYFHVEPGKSYTVSFDYATGASVVDWGDTFQKAAETPKTK